MSKAVYHVELRQFPHNLCRFNLDEAQLAQITDAWAHGQWLELGERRWNPAQARLTVLAGPELPLAQLTMGRGWRIAERASEDVTDRVLVAARGRPRLPPAGTSAEGGAGAGDLLTMHGDSLGLELLSALGQSAAPLSRVWPLAHERFPESPPSEALALAERAVASLLQRGLVVLCSTGDVETPPGEGEGGAERALACPALGQAAAEEALGRLEHWTTAGADAGIWIRRV